MSGEALNQPRGWLCHWLAGLPGTDDQHLAEVGLGGVGVLAVPDVHMLFRNHTRTPEAQVETLDLLHQCYLGKVGLVFFNP